MIMFVRMVREFGHAYPAVIEAVKQACEQGLTFGAPTKKEYEIASLIHDMMPSME